MFFQTRLTISFFFLWYLTLNTAENLPDNLRLSQRGAPGLPGTPWQEGALGQQGAPGQQGAQGSPGAPGLSGSPGQRGASGDTGRPDTAIKPPGSDEDSDLGPIDEHGVYEQQKKTVYGCEGSVVKITCQEGAKIKVHRANFGRLRRDICPQDGTPTDGWSLRCMSTRSLLLVQQLCENRVQCMVSATNRIFWDPCPATPKYLEVQFECVQDNSVKPTFPPVVPSTSTPTLLPISNETTTPSSSPQTIAISTFQSGTNATTTTTSPGTTMTSSMTTSSAGTTKPSTAPFLDVKVTSTTESPMDGMQGDEPRSGPCPAIRRRDIDWPETIPHKVIYRQCPNMDKYALAWWLCDGPEWSGHPDLSRCISEPVIKLQDKMTTAKQYQTVSLVEEVANDLVTVSTQSVTYGGDLDTVTEVMKDLVNEVDIQIHNVSKEEGDHLVRSVNQAVVDSSSNVLDQSKAESWLDLPQKTQAEAATKVLSSVEKSANQVAKSLKEPAVVRSVSVNIVLEINVFDITLPKIDDICFPRSSSEWQPTSSNSITLTGETIRSMGVNGLSKLIFTTFKNIEQYLATTATDGQAETTTTTTTTTTTSAVYKKTTVSNWERNKHKYMKDIADDMKETIVNTEIISASFGDAPHMSAVPLPEPVYYTLEHITSLNVYNPTCAFWEYSERTMDGSWQTFGCDVHDTNVTHTVCKCSHLTHFAVLMDVVGVPLDKANVLSLTVITIIGCIISIICLLLAWITFVFFKNLQCDRNTIHKNLVLTLLIAEILFLVGINQTKPQALCSVMAGFLHFFFLSAFAWMCLEGIQLYVMLVEVFEAERSRVKWYYLAGYGLPALIVIITAAVRPTGYGTSKYCWLAINDGVIWAFVGPVILVLAMNMVMLVIAIYMMCRHARATASWKMRQKTRIENVRSWLKGAAVLMVLLGLTWVFGLFYINRQSVIMAYVFTILNSLQGLFIFYFHCATNDKVQKEYKRWVRRTTWLPEIVRVKYGGASSTSSPNHSYSTNNPLQRLLGNRWRKRSSTTSLPKSSSSNNTPVNKWPAAGLTNRESDHLVQTDSGLSPVVSMYASDDGPTETLGHYMEPRCIDSGIDFDNAAEFSYMEGSIADSNYFDQLCHKAGPRPAIDVDKYMINPAQPGATAPPRLRQVTGLDAYRLSPLPEVQQSESDYSDGDLPPMTEKAAILREFGNAPSVRAEEFNDKMDAHDSGSEMGSLDSIARIKLGLGTKRRLSSSDSGTVDASVNDLNRSSGSDRDHYMVSRPNICCPEDALPSSPKDLHKLNCTLPRQTGSDWYSDRGHVQHDTSTLPPRY